MAVTHCALLSRTYSPLFLGQRDEQRLQRGAGGTSGRGGLWGPHHRRNMKSFGFFGRQPKVVVILPQMLRILNSPREGGCSVGRVGQ